MTIHPDILILRNGEAVGLGGPCDELTLRDSPAGFLRVRT